MIDIRLADLNDLRHLEDVERSAAKAFLILPGYKDDSSTVPLEMLEKMAADKNLWVAVAERDKIVGFIGCRKMDDFLYIHEISVAFEHQKQGIGCHLVRTVINEAARAGYSAIGLTTRRDATWNMPFYKKMGFVEVKDKQKWPGLFSQLEKQIENGADPSLRCAMVKDT